MEVVNANIESYVEYLITHKYDIVWLSSIDTFSTFELVSKKQQWRWHFAILPLSSHTH